MTFLWHDPDGRHNHLFVYTAEYVNRLRNMLERHLRQPHELVCVTDLPEGIDERVRVIAPTPPESEWPGFFKRLMFFRPDAAEIFGERILLMDLDCVILRNIDPLLEGAGEFKAWEPRLYYANHRHYSRYNMSFVLMDAGCRARVWSEFSPDKAARVLGDANLAIDDQTWLSHVIGPDEPTWPWDGDIRSLKATPEPEAARIVFFNGPRSPAMAEVQRDHPRIAEQWR